jgi:hypothetical protein
LLSQEKCVHHFDKARIADMVKGYMVSRLLDGGKILNDSSYLNNVVKETVFELLNYVSLDSEESIAHFYDIKSKVINPAISLLGSEPSRLPIVNGSDTYR